MRDIQELLDEKSHLVRSCEDISARATEQNRLVNDEEKRMIADFLKQAKLCDEEIKAIQDNIEIQKSIDEFSAGIRQPGSQKAAPPSVSNDGTREPRIEIPSHQARYGKLKAFHGKNAEANAYKSGQWFRASYLNDYRSKEWCRRNGVDFQNALSEGVNTAGGFLVPDEFTQAIIDLRESYGVFRRECRVLPMGREVMMIPRRNGGVTASFVGENPASAMSESDPSFSQVQLTAKELAVMTRMSTSVADDAIIDLADWLAQEFAYAFALKEDQCGFIGDGTTTYGGITGVMTKFNNNTSLAGAVAIADQTHNLFTEINATDIAVLMGKLPQYASLGAKFYCSQEFADVVFGRLMAAAGGNTIQTIEGGYSMRYLGHDIVTSQVLPTGSATDYNNLGVCLYGRLDLAATLGDRRGFELVQSRERYMEYRQIAVLGAERFDIVVHDVGDTSTAGPIVALIASSS